MAHLDLLILFTIIVGLARYVAGFSLDIDNTGESCWR
jgi:hypothetical protein